jgi:hypothetical protein
MVFISQGNIKGPIVPGRFNVGAALADSVIHIGKRKFAIGSSGRAIKHDVPLLKTGAAARLSQNQAFERIGTFARQNLKQLNDNFIQARKESNQFFKLTLVFAGLGFFVVLVGVSLLLAKQVPAGIVSTISSIIPEVTAALFFRKDKELRDRIDLYHQNIIESQKIMSMIDVAETIKNEKEKDLIKRQIIFKVVGIEEFQVIKPISPVSRTIKDIEIPEIK